MIAGTSGGTEYACSDPQDPANVLTVRDTPFGPRRAIPRKDWDFVENSKLGAGLRAFRLTSGFEPGKIYEVVYRAQDPVVVGLGLAAVRDFASYLKSERNDVAPVQRVEAMGISQSGRFLRQFLFDGFNADENGKKAIDGLLIHVAGAGRGSFNHRFAQPSRDAQPTNTFFYPTDIFPFADIPTTDPVTGQKAGLLDRAVSARVVPKIFYTNTSYEYWSRAASLISTSPDGKKDLPLLDNVRIYFAAGLQHFSASFPPKRDEESALLGQNLPNPNPILYFWRSWFVAMDAWVHDEKAPPPSVYPKLSDHTLISRAELKFPKISGVHPPGRVQQAFHLDFGPQWKSRIIVKQPATVGAPFPVFVPQIDPDGNDLGGIRLPELDVPIATYTGWNLRDPSTGLPAERVSFIGSDLPFPKTSADAKTADEPRRPIAERYPSREEYLTQFRAAAEKLSAARFLLPEDLDALVKRGGEEWDWATTKPPAVPEPPPIAPR
ncbi:MAG: alpha/beta hydrolase domain-containing protein [Chthoniobacterales bacterium]